MIVAWQPATLGGKKYQSMMQRCTMREQRKGYEDWKLTFLDTLALQTWSKL